MLCYWWACRQVNYNNALIVLHCYLKFIIFFSLPQRKTKVVKMINLISTLAHQTLKINMKKPYAITTNHCHVICMDVQAPTRDEKIKIIFVLFFCKMFFVIIHCSYSKCFFSNNCLNKKHTLSNFIYFSSWLW